MRDPETGASDVDVAIIGGGMVGASLAHMLSTLSLSVAVVEATPVESADQPSFDARTTALSNATRATLDTLGVWESAAAEATPIRSIHVSERGRFGRAVIDAAEQGLSAIGYVLPNRTLGRELWRRLRLSPRTRLVAPARVTGLATTGDRVRLQLDGDGGSAPLSARLVVAADGADSLVRAAAGVALDRSDYGQTAIVTSISPARFHAHVAYERFTPDGPVAVLPQADGRCVMILTVSPEDAARVLALDDRAFVAVLQERFGWRLGALSAPGRRDAYPLALTQAAESTAPRIALIGSAAQGLHPIAGQGFNLGLRDAATLAEAIADALAAGAADVGGPEVLAPYAERRRRDRRALIAFTDGLVRLYASDALALRTGRALGLLAFDLSAPAKRAMAGLSRGFSPAQPRLARGLPLVGRPRG